MIPLLEVAPELGELVGGLGELEVAGEVPIKVPLDSSAIRSATYVATKEQLTLDMTDGTVIEYYDCPPEIFAGLINAPSAGAYYNRFIRRGFRFSQRA